MNTVPNYFCYSPRTCWFKVGPVNFGWDSSLAWKHAERRIFFGFEGWRGVQRVFYTLHLWPFAVSWSRVNRQQPESVRRVAKTLTDGAGIQF